MLHFLAKLGKKKWTSKVAPTIVCSAAGGYFAFQMYGHKIFRNFLVARDTSGLNIELTDHVKSLILETYNDIEDKLFKEIFQFPGIETKRNPIKWFASSSMEPVTIGMSESRTGFIVGLPFFFNCTKTMDLPDSTIRFKKLRFFKKIVSDPEGDKINQSLDRTKFNANQELIPPWESGIDRKDPDVKAYLDSMILSDNAIKFAIARELFMGDSYKPLVKFGAMFISALATMTLTRFTVQKMNLRSLHVSRRLGLYAVSTAFAAYQYKLFSSTIDWDYTKKCDIAAMDSGENYRLGAIEYLEKMRSRNQALYKLFADAREVFWPNGDRRNGLFFKRYVPIEERLSWARLEEETKQTAKSSEQNSPA